MNFLDLNLKPEYRSFRDDVIKNFLCPVLKRTVVYKRAVGSFSASALFALRDGICELIENGGKIQIIASAKDLLAHDIEAIDEGLRLCDEVNENDLIRALKTSRDSFNFLRDLIASGRLEFKIAKLENSDGIGMFHEKLGLMYDAENNVIAFSGSMNESFNAFKNNYESIDVFTSWTNDADRVKAKEVAFDSLWNNRESGVNVIACENKFRVKEFAEVLQKEIANIQHIYNTGSLRGVPTGLTDVEKVLNGLHKSDLILLAACPSMGKTSLALNIAVNAAKMDKVIALFSFEMNVAQITQRFLSSESKVNSLHLNTGNLSGGDMGKIVDAREDLLRLNIFIDDAPDTSVKKMRLKTRQLQCNRGLDLIVVDYLQLMKYDKEFYGNRAQEISAINRELKILARELDVPILVVSQLSQNVETRTDRRPKLFDLPDSLAQDADIVLFLYRDEYYNRDESENENIAELIIAKNRNGPTTSVTLYFQKEYLLFRNLERER